MHLHTDNAKSKGEKPLINNHKKDMMTPLIIIKKLVVRSDKHCCSIGYLLAAAVGIIFFLLNCAAWVLVSAVRQSFASDWLAGGWQQLVVSWPLPSVGRQCCWVKVKLKESVRSPVFRWWSKQWPHTLNIWPAVWKQSSCPVFFNSLKVSSVLCHKGGFSSCCWWRCSVWKRERHRT